MNRDLAKRIALCVADLSLAPLIAEIADRSNADRYLFHGIKRASAAEIERYGIETRTPEGGNVSYWTAGTAFFSSYRDRFNPRDTTLFEYLGDPMLLAVSRRPESDGFMPDRVNMLAETVPYADLELIELTYPPNPNDPRSARQLAEQRIIRDLHGLVTGGYRPGTTIRTSQ